MLIMVPDLASLYSFNSCTCPHTSFSGPITVYPCHTHITPLPCPPATATLRSPAAHVLQCPEDQVVDGECGESEECHRRRLLHVWNSGHLDHLGRSRHKHGQTDRYTCTHTHLTLCLCCVGLCSHDPHPLQPPTCHVLEQTCFSHSL